MKVISVAFFSLCFSIATGQGKPEFQNDTEILSAIIQQCLKQIDSLDSIEAIVMATDLELLEYSSAYTFLHDVPKLEIFSVNGTRLKSPKSELEGKKYYCLYITSENTNIILQFVSLHIDPDTDELLLITGDDYQNQKTFKVSDNRIIEEIKK